MTESNSAKIHVSKYRTVWLVTEGPRGRIIRVRKTWRGAMDSACAHIRRRGQRG
ncbi:hypothetical protein HOS57_gp38 [Streptomyces phage AbbeyMikolon]|uniref:Uncharacterized protein n=1 Tax=Streptomyces phage AbbeyMikolon TaxID=2059880 RepID=A0A2H5BLA0_9CAUD|nr:hypothetical protein HOS57_gp38 [Streptomyces phage AbbeyMikolon]AUG87109.1 hypothetical protein SEA_ABBEYMIKOLON_38 [Streptomyces phage AbbeyMikolon]